MKIKLTKKETKNVRPRCVSFGYCELHSLFSAFFPEGYISGINGWDADVYFSIDDEVTVTSGYRGVGTRAQESDYKDLVPANIDRLSLQERKACLREIVKRVAMKGE